ncbi:MAG: ankyrin repeat domain-containing protein [Gammaproteobacteria bacterium]
MPKINISNNNNPEISLYSAVANGDFNAVRKLLEAEVNLKATLAAKGEGGNTPLHVAAEKGYDDLVKELLKAGAELEIRNSDGDTPLHLAAYNGRVDVVESLLNKGANLEAENN